MRICKETGEPTLYLDCLECDEDCEYARNVGKFSQKEKEGE